MATTIYTDLLAAYEDVKQKLTLKVDKADSRGAALWAINSDKAIYAMSEDGSIVDPDTIQNTYAKKIDVNAANAEQDERLAALEDLTLLHGQMIEELTVRVDGHDDAIETINDSIALLIQKDTDLDGQISDLNDIKLDKAEAETLYASLAMYPNLTSGTIIDKIGSLEDSLNEKVNDNKDNIDALMATSERAGGDIADLKLRVDGHDTAIGQIEQKFNSYTSTADLEANYLTKNDAGTTYATIVYSDTMDGQIRVDLANHKKGFESFKTRAENAIIAEGRDRTRADEEITAAADTLKSEFESFKEKTNTALAAISGDAKSFEESLSKLYVEKSKFENAQGQSLGMNNAYGFVTKDWLTAELGAYLTKAEAGATYITTTRAAEIYVTKSSIDEEIKKIAESIGSATGEVTKAELESALSGYVKNTALDLKLSGYMTTDYANSHFGSAQKLTALENTVKNLGGTYLTRTDAENMFVTEDIFIETVNQMNTSTASQVSALTSTIANNTTSIGTLDSRVTALEADTARLDTTVGRVDTLENDIAGLKTTTSAHTAAITQIQNVVKDIQSGVITDFVGVNINIEKTADGEGGDLAVDGNISCSSIQIGDTLLIDADVAKVLLKLIKNWSKIKALLDIAENLVVKDDLAEYLPLAGGTLTGDLVVNTDITTLGSIFFDADKTKGIKVD